nr:membrane bound O-acyl transferase family-domain-containing protein [Ardenticatenales bacterium]
TLLQLSQTTLASFSKVGLFLFMTLWPGMDPRPFRRRQPGTPVSAELFISGFAFLWLGLALGFGVAWIQPVLGDRGVGWLGLLALLFMIHFGYAQLLTGLMRLAGWKVSLLFDEPLKSRSLSDFWSRRWNLAFVQMDRQLFLRPLHRRLGKVGALVGVFALSGLLHELGISYPTLSGWGLPLLYFILQGVLLWLEIAVFKVEQHWPVALGRLWSWAAILLPLPLLFHGAFREALVLPLYASLHQVVAAHSLAWYFDWALRLAAVGHLCVLMASAQVPSRLGWKEDLGKLTPFNRKVMWTYGGFIVLCIISFGVLTWVLRPELLRGEPAALGLAAFNGLFWGARVGVDLVYFRHEDWPKGLTFEVGHLLLSTLFICMTAVYFSLLLWHLA